MSRAAPGEAPAISVVMPCLNEAQSVALCVEKALRGIEATGLTGEVVVVDNGSTDGSAELAAEAGARVVTEPRRGYGSAYLRGFEEAPGPLSGDGRRRRHLRFHRPGALRRAAPRARRRHGDGLAPRG